MCKVTITTCPCGFLRTNEYESCEGKAYSHLTASSYEFFEPIEKCPMAGWDDDVLEHVRTTTTRTVYNTQLCRCMVTENQGQAQNNFEVHTLHAKCGCKVSSTKEVEIPPSRGVDVKVETRHCMEVGPQCKTCRSKASVNEALEALQGLGLGK